MIAIPCLPCCILAIGSLAIMALLGSYTIGRYRCRNPKIQRSASQRDQSKSTHTRKDSKKPPKPSVHNIEAEIYVKKNQKGKNTNWENEREENNAERHTQYAYYNQQDAPRIQKYVEKQNEYAYYNQQDAPIRQNYEEDTDSIEALERRMENYRRNHSEHQQWEKHSQYNDYKY